LPYEDRRRVVESKPAFKQVSLALRIAPFEDYLTIYA
jgi:hypothetical protein